MNQFGLPLDVVVLFQHILLDLFKKHWSIALHDLDLVHEVLDVLACNHFHTVLGVSALELSYLVEGLVQGS